jgi:hypothetical protein
MGRSFLVDASVALVLLALITAQLLTTPQPGAEPANAWAYLLGATFTLPYAVHRRRPFVALAVCCGGVILYSLGHFAGYPGYAIFVLVFGIALHGHRESALFSSRSFLSMLAAPRGARSSSTARTW